MYNRIQLRNLDMFVDDFGRCQDPSFEGNAVPLLGAIVGATTVDLSSTDYVNSQPTRALWVAVIGSIKCDLMAGYTGTTFYNVPVGLWPLRVTRIYKTGTTAGMSMIGCM